jgi:hypothetical protein
LAKSTIHSDDDDVTGDDDDKFNLMEFDLMANGMFECLFT